MTQEKPSSKLEMRPSHQAAIGEDPRFLEALAAIKAMEEGGYEARLAGGCVRDRLLGVLPKDYDIATTAEPLVVQRFFTQRGQKIIPTGVDHGTVTLVGGAGPYEITTLRRDVQTDGRRAVVAFSKSFAEDAERRDFTINAMYEDSTGAVHDFFEGRAHLQQRRLVFVGDASTRIKEDYLRILRFFRFWARLDFQPDEGAMGAIQALASGLSAISQERITSELLQILAAPRPGRVLSAMEQSGVWSKIMPEAPLDPVLVKVVDCISGHRAEADELAIFRLAVLMSAVSTSALSAIGKRLRLATSDIHKLRCFGASLEKIQDAVLVSDVAACMEFVDFVEETAGHGVFERIFCEAFRAFLAEGQHATGSPPRKKFQEYLGVFERIVAVEAESGALRKQPMPLNGKRLMRDLHVHPGPQMKILLQELKRQFRRGEWVTPEQGIQNASAIIAKVLPAQK